jgi:predicted metal-dependent peptidase
MGESITSRMKVNRRYDIVMPGYRRKYKSKIIFAIDISGSMSDEDIAEGFAVINSCCKHADIDYLTFDSEIKSIEKNFRKAKKAFKLHGRGGTIVEPVLEYAKEQKADGLVVFSDMYFSAPAEPNHLKVLWLSHTAGQEPPVPWGFKAALKRFDDVH